MSLLIEADWEKLNSGTPEERACFAAIGIKSNDIWITQAEDILVRRIRDKIYLSGYRLAEWLAWNWWRLRWEPRGHTLDWSMAHRMSTIGGGYIWPNISIVSDGERIAILAKSTEQVPQEPMRYIRDLAVVVQAKEFENTLDLFLSQISGQLRAESLADTNFEQIWSDVLAERNNPEVAKWRCLEALLGYDPGEAPESSLNRLLEDAKILGEKSMIEVAADHRQDAGVITAAEINEIARTNGFNISPNNAVVFQPGTQLPPIGEFPAWRRGAEAARILREQQNLGNDMISNARLTQMTGLVSTALGDKTVGPSFSFALINPGQSGQMVFRSKGETGRRFQLARILGDCLAGQGDGLLHPATRSATYRQKMQRSFAAEFLCPFEGLDDMLAGDYSSENIEEASEYYSVSELTVRTLLVNHRRIDRQEIEGDMDLLTAA